MLIRLIILFQDLLDGQLDTFKVVETVGQDTTTRSSNEHNESHEMKHQLLDEKKLIFHMQMSTYLLQLAIGKMVKLLGKLVTQKV